MTRQYNLVPHQGSHLIVIPPLAIGSWAREFSKVFGTKPTFGIQLGVKWGQAKKTVGEAFEYTDDLEEALMVDKSWLPTYASSNKIVLTSNHSATYEALWVGMSHTWTDRAGNAQEATHLSIHWASVTVDEVHKVRAKKNPLMTDALMQIKSSFYNTADRQPPRFPCYPPLPPTQMWFISGTLWERNIDDLSTILLLLEQPSWGSSESPYHPLTSVNIKKVADTHNQLVKSIQKEDELPDGPKARAHVAAISELCPKFIIRRDYTSTVAGSSCVPMPPLWVDWLSFNTPYRFQPAITAYRSSQASREKQQYFKEYADWRKKLPKCPTAPRPIAPNSASRKHEPSRTLRVLATFPALVDFMDDQDGNKIESLFTESDLKGRMELWTAHLDTILKNSPKFRAIVSLLKGKAPGKPPLDENGKSPATMGPRDKLLVVSAFPFVAWFINEVSCCSCTPTFPSLHLGIVSAMSNTILNRF